MAADPPSKPSFSPGRKWGIGLQVFLIILVVLSVVVMVNYLSRDYFTRFHWSTRSKIALSPLTVKFLQSVTNRVKVTLYYDKNEPSYTTISALLNEYKLINPRISIQNIDYLRDAGAAAKIKTEYKLTFPTATNLIIFDCEGRTFPVDGNALTHYEMEQVPNEKDREFRRKPTQFEGEKMFTSAILVVTSPRRPTAYFLTGDGEHPIESNEDSFGYLNFASLVQQYWIRTQPIILTGTNALPMDGLLIIAGPQFKIDDVALEKIDQYLSQGGRLLALFSFRSLSQETGLEKVLAKWGVEVGNKLIKDPDNTYSGSDIVVSDFGKHPIFNPLLGEFLQVIEPRAVGRRKSAAPAADAPRVEEIAFSGPNAFAKGLADHRQRFPLMVAVEKGAIKGVITERGSTRMVIVGDSLFLANHQLAAGANRDFAVSTINWLLDRTQLLEGLGARPIREYRLIMTPGQLQQAQWLLLGAMPGAALLLGGLVWFRRRR
jgi:ABC-2 type transport system permease protein